jgi:hypothetical protein
MRYGNESLAASGIAVWNSQIAMTLRPDLWSSGVDCGMDFGRLYSRQVIDSHLDGKCHTCFVTLEGIDARVKVLARSLDMIAKRVEWLTGYTVIKIDVESHVPRPVRAVVPPRVAVNGDRFSGVVTKEAGIACSNCNHFTAGHSCRNPEVSGIAVPDSRVGRRCLAFVPIYESMDSRSGVQRWPELVALAQGSKELEVNHVGL